MSTRPTWAAHLRGAQPVRLRVRGCWRTAKPTVVEDREPVADLFGKLARRKGRQTVAAIRIVTDCPATGNPPATSCWSPRPGRGWSGSSADCRLGILLGHPAASVCGIGVPASEARGWPLALGPLSGLLVAWPARGLVLWRRW